MQSEQFPERPADTSSGEDLGSYLETEAPLAMHAQQGPALEDDWRDEDGMPMRPRRKLLTPLTAVLLTILAGAAGFWVGVKVQKDNSSTTSATAAPGAGFASRAQTTGARKGTFGAGAPSFTGAGAASSGGTTGEVADIRGNTLYVTDTEGNTVRVVASSATKVSHTVTTSVSAIQPGDTVTVEGTKGSSGAIAASSVSLSSAATSTTSDSTSSGTSASTLFGEG